MVRTHGRRGELNEWEESDSGTLSGPALEADEIFSPTRHTRLSTTTSQTIQNDTLTEVAFDTVENDDGGFANLSNNAVEIPSSPNISDVKAIASVAFVGNPDAVQAVIRDVKRPNYGQTPGLNPFGDSFIEFDSFVTEVSGGENITAEVRQTSGSSLNLQANIVFLEVVYQ